MNRLVAIFLSLFVASTALADGFYNGGGGGSSGTLPVDYQSGISSWIAPLGQDGQQAGSAVTANTIYCNYGYFGANVTVKALGASLNAASSGNNFQLAIYSVSGGTMTLVDSIGSILMSSSAGPFSNTLANTTDMLSAGVLYGLCANSSGTPAYVTSELISPILAQLIGSTTLANVTSTSPAIGKSIAQTFGTWPGTLTLSAMTDLTSRLAPVVALEVN